MTSKYRLISRKFSGMKFFTRAFDNQSNRSISVRLLFLFDHVFSFQGHTKIALNCELLSFFRRS